MSEQIIGSPKDIYSKIFIGDIHLLVLFCHHLDWRLTDRELELINFYKKCKSFGGVSSGALRLISLQIDRQWVTSSRFPPTNSKWKLGLRLASLSISLPLLYKGDQHNQPLFLYFAFCVLAFR